MNSRRNFWLSCVCALLGSCASQTPTAVFPELSKLDRVWKDDSGSLFSAIQDEDGDFVVHDPASGSFYYYRREDGELVRRPSHAPDLSYSQGKMQFGSTTLVPADVVTEELRFSSGGVDFFGLLTTPLANNPVPLVVNSHGSENSAATSFDWAAAWYAQAGYATFIFDKRGTGQSGGNFTHNFDLLADDLSAAVAAAAQHSSVNPDFVGVGGYSQGVYVTTLAATRDDNIKFVIASYGMTESPLVEELQITQALFEETYPEKNWSEFEPFAKACVAAFALEKNERWGDVKRLKRNWRNEVDPGDLETTMVGDGCLSWPPFILRVIGRSQLPPDVIWEYDPKPIMASLDVPVIWQFGEADTTAPSATSIDKVQQWINSGKPFVKYSYADANHGMYLTTTSSAGETYRYKDPQYIGDLINWLNQNRLSYVQSR